MMRFIYINLFLLCFCSCSSAQSVDCKKEYSRKIVDDIYDDSFLLTVTAEYAGEKFKIVIEDYDLEKILIANNQKYEPTFLEKLIKGKEVLKLDDQKINEVEIIRSWKNVDEIIKKGKDYTLEHYFYNTLQRPNKLSIPERDFLIDALVNWCIPIYIDDESGYLKISP